MRSSLIYYQNVRGLKSKVNEFYNNILTTEFDIISITETWLDESVYSSEFFSDEWSVFRQDGREMARGGACWSRSGLVFGAPNFFLFMLLMTTFPRCG